MYEYECIEILLDRSTSLFELSKNDELSKIDFEIMQNIKEVSVQNLIFAIMVRPEVEITSRDVPMYSDFKDCTSNICVLLDAISNIGIEYIPLGGALLGYVAKEMAHYKYGESHAKAAEILGLVTTEKSDGSNYKAYLTKMGKYFACNENDREEIIVRLILSSKIVQKILKHKDYDCKVSDLISFLSQSTIIRRMPNIKRFIKELVNIDKYMFKEIIESIDFSTNF